jgi:hypothetical protein
VGTLTLMRSSKAAVRRLVLSLTFAAAVVIAVPVSATAALRGLQRDEGIVLTGAQLPRLLGTLPRRLVAYRQVGDTWQRVPVQVDQRFMVDLARLYDQSTPSGIRVEVYADPNTWVGRDPNPRIDHDDQISLSAASAGRVSGKRPPARLGSRFTRIVLGTRGHQAAIWVGVARSDPGPSPSAGVHYDFGLLSGDYRATYGLQAGRNPEDSTVTTPFYSRHFSDRWLTDGLRIGAGPNILEREKFQFSPGDCSRTEDTFDAGEGAFEANISGPVRAIRSFIGTNSGPFTQRTEVFWPHYEQDITTLRVHPIPGIMDFFALSDAALGMRLSISTDPSGVLIDGSPDTLPTTEPRWMLLTGPPGSLTEVLRIRTSFAYQARLYELDQRNPDGGAQTQCTGLDQAIGEHGTWIDSPLPNTDPRFRPAQSLVATNTLFFEKTHISTAGAVQRAQQVDHPLPVKIH